MKKYFTFQFSFTWSYILLILFLTQVSCQSNERTERDHAEDGEQPVIPDVNADYFYLNGKKMSFDVLEDKLPVEFRSLESQNTFLRSAADLSIDTSFKFHDIAILQKNNGHLRAADTSSMKSLIQPQGNLVGVIKVSESGASLILTNRIIARFKAGVSDRAIDSVANALQCKVIESSLIRRGRVVLECSSEDVIVNANELFESNLVEFSHPDFIAEIETRELPYTPNDPLFARQWHLQNTGQGHGRAGADISATRAWEISRGSQEVIIAFIDDGFDVNHEDLKDNLLLQKDFSANPPDDNAFPDRSGETHGTKVLGLAVAKGGNARGVSGICSECRYIAIRALGGPESKQADAIDFAVASGAWIISNSWGYSLRSVVTDDVVSAINNAAINGRNGIGCVVFFAMTNSYTDNCTGPTPDISSLSNVIAISGSSNFDQRSRSGYGKCMDLLAPTYGGNGTMPITTTHVTGHPSSRPINYCEDFNGTSAATPIVAGVAGLMLSVNKDLTPTQVRNILAATADKIDPANARYDATGFSTTHGYGRINAYEALRAIR